MNNPQKRLSINKWSEDDRPREKMISKGSSALSNAELLAILIGSGSREESAVELMKRILSECDNNLNTLAKWSYKDYKVFKGMGEAKSVAVMAALELGKRRKQEEVRERRKIKSSNDIYEIYQPLMCDLPHEEFWLLLLNNNLNVIDNVKIGAGGVNSVYVDVRDVMREVITHRAVSIALAHNHPSGNISPSQQDRELTENIRKAAHIMNIKLIDHIIVCEDNYYSFVDEGLL